MDDIFPLNVGLGRSDQNSSRSAGVNQKPADKKERGGQEETSTTLEKKHRAT